MKKKTDLEEIKQIAKDMIYIGVDKVDEFGITPNPFTASRYVLIDNELVSIGDWKFLTIGPTVSNLVLTIAKLLRD